MSNGMTPYGYRHSRLSLDQRPVKDEVETDSEGEYASDFTGLTAEEAKLTNAAPRKPKKPPWMTNPDLNKDPVKSHPLNQADINVDDECDVAKLTSAEMNLHQDAQGSTAHHKHHHGDSSFGGNIDEGGHEHEAGDQSHTHRPFTGGKPTFGRTNSAEYGKVEPVDDSDPDSEDPGGGYDEDEAPTPTAGNQRDAPELDKQHSDYPDEDDDWEKDARDFDYLDARRSDEHDEELDDLYDDESPEDARDAGGPDEPDFHLDKAEQGFHNTVHGSSAASLALSKSQEIVRKFSAGPAAVALADGEPAFTDKRSVAYQRQGAAQRQADAKRPASEFQDDRGFTKAAPNVFRDDSPYSVGGGAGRASGGQGAGSPGMARQTQAPASRPQVGQSMGGARAGQPSGGMQPKRNIAYATEPD